MMEDKPMTGEEVLQQILGALNGNGMQQASSDAEGAFAGGQSRPPLQGAAAKKTSPSQVRGGC